MASHAVTQWLPGGTPAWRSNVMSCAVDSLAGVFVFLAAELWTRGTPHHDVVGAAGGTQCVRAETRGDGRGAAAAAAARGVGALD